ncbi:MAG: hypothetical protein LC722_06245 [Actinobacteria bacterium]|nr:hypothetical protein [Acidobacteriota bacterium]MCA1727246.1 hypothetical protein [Actinomycetota bacterium]
MIALIRYTFATMLHSQRYLASVLLFMGAVGVLSSNDDGPLTPTYGVCAAALFVCATWLTIALISVEDPTHRAITVVSAGRSSRVLLATIAVAVLSCLALAVVGLVFPLLFGNHSASGLDLLVGAGAQLACASVGIAIGLLCSRLVMRRQGYALLVALALVLTALFVPGLPPVNALLQLMSNVPESAELAVPVSGFLALAAAILAASGTVTQFLTTRRD